MPVLVSPTAKIKKSFPKKLKKKIEAFFFLQLITPNKICNVL